MDTPTPSATQLSPGRDWWWTGTEWVAAATNADAQAAIAALDAPISAIPMLAPDVVRPAPVPARPAPVVSAQPVVVAEPVAPVAVEPVVAEPVASVAAPVAEPIAAPVAAPFAAAAVAAAVGAGPYAAPFSAPTITSSFEPAPPVSTDHRPPGWAPPAPVFGAGQAAPKQSQLGVFSLILGIIPLFGIGAILAIVLGKKSHKENARLGLPRDGKATAGIVLGWFWIVLVVLAGIVLPLVLKLTGVGHPTQSSIENLRSAVNAEDALQARTGHYGSMVDLLSNGYQPVGSSRVTVLRADATSYCLKLTQDSGTAWFDSSTRRMSQKRCS